LRAHRRPVAHRGAPRLRRAGPDALSAHARRRHRARVGALRRARLGKRRQRLDAGRHPRARRSHRGAVIAELEEARAATLSLVSDLDDEALRAQPDPGFSPIGWHLGHVAFTEAHWILQRVGGDGSLVAPYARRWAQDGCPKHERTAQPPKTELFAYMSEVRARSIALLAGLDPKGDDPLVAGGFVAWLIESHEHQHR